MWDVGMTKTLLGAMYACVAPGQVWKKWWLCWTFAFAFALGLELVAQLPPWAWAWAWLWLRICDG